MNAAHKQTRASKSTAQTKPPFGSTTAHHRGFTIVELLVVISIIALLISIAIPSFRKAQTQAKRVATQTTITAISSGLELFRGEQALGSKYPPSQSDRPTGDIQDPFDDSGTAKVTGATLLVLALIGPDQQGTAGFSGSGGGYWGDTTGGPGSSPIPPANVPPRYDPANNAPRYGPYAEGKLLESIEPIEALDFAGNPIGLKPKGIARASDLTPHEAEQRFFVDEFNRPILYYRARSAAKNMITQPNGAIGIYDHRDNSLLTGGIEPGTPSTMRTGVQFTSKPHRSGPIYHRIDTTRYDGDSNFGIDPGNGDTAALPFDAYIIDPKSTVSARPVNPSSFLLISAGPDGFYGTNDDVKNWGN